MHELGVLCQAVKTVSAMADGLSGTYQSAVAAAEGDARITVINSTTLCGPHRYMVEQAAKLAAQGAEKQEIIDTVHTMMESDVSFLMPDDFDYLRRGGRLSPLVSFVGKTIRLAPVLTQSEDGRQLVMAGVKHSFRQAIEHVIKALEKHGVSEGWRIHITHAAAIEKAEKAKEMLLEKFPTAVYEIHPLTPAFITQGGPGCVAVQVIKEL